MNKFSTFFRNKNKVRESQQGLSQQGIIKYDVGSRVPKNTDILDIAEKVIKENQQFINKINRPYVRR